MPIPPGVFGPITAWDPEGGVITVEGDIPPEVGNGVYVRQCNADGTLFTQGWNTSQQWSANTTGSVDGGFDVIFDGSLESSAWTTGSRGMIYFSNLPIESSLRVYFNKGANYPPNPYEVVVQGQVIDISALNSLDNASQWVDVTPALTFLGNFQELRLSASGQGSISAVQVDQKILVNEEFSLNMRVNSVLDNLVIGVANQTVDFTIGKYLRVPEQRVAPWVLYGNDPTSLIDHLRSS